MIREKLVQLELEVLFFNITLKVYIKESNKSHTASEPTLKQSLYTYKQLVAKFILNF